MYTDIVSEVTERFILKFVEDLEYRIVYVLFNQLPNPIRCKLSRRVIKQRKIEIECINFVSGFAYLLKVTPFEYCTSQTLIDLNFQGKVLQEYKRWVEENQVFLRKKMYIDLQQAQQFLPH